MTSLFFLVPIRVFFLHNERQAPSYQERRSIPIPAPLIRSTHHHRLRFVNTSRREGYDGLFQSLRRVDSKTSRFIVQKAAVSPFVAIEPMSFDFGSRSEDGIDFEGASVKDPCENDVLCGRGGSINSHPGNERFRRLVEKRKRVYLTARFKREKRLIASSIVSEIRALDPPGRFLARDPKSGMWKDIGDEKARDKTSQALRENAPSIRAEIEVEIHEQRAEMQRDESSRIQPPPPRPPPPPPSYYGWAGYHSYYGYSQPPPPPPPGHPYPPPPPPPYDMHWGAPPPPPHHYYDGGQQGHAYSQSTHTPSKSAFDYTADLVQSSAESIKNWAGSSLSGIMGSTVSQDGRDNRSVTSSSSKPIVYVHDRKKRRMVKFQEPGRRTTRPCYDAHAHGENSLVDGIDVEPHKLDEVAIDDHNSSIMTQFANQVLSSIGSWDAGSALCGHDSTYEKGGPYTVTSNGAHLEEEMEVEWEGQEVQLLDPSSEQSVNSEDRMPPPVPRNTQDHFSSVGFSSLGSCHSWLPEQISGAASLFSSSRQGSVTSMDFNEHYSSAGSSGGGSLSRVFENDPHMYSMSSPREIGSLPSWERGVRPRSPHSMEEDDASLMSKSSSKFSESAASRPMIQTVYEYGS